MNEKSTMTDSFFKFVSPLQDASYTLRYLRQIYPNLIFDHHSSQSGNEGDFTSGSLKLKQNDLISCRQRKVMSHTDSVDHDDNSYLMGTETYSSTHLDSILNKPKSNESEQKSIPYIIHQKWDIPLIQGVHYDEHELQRFRSCGDEEMDLLLSLYDKTISYERGNQSSEVDIHDVRARLQSFDIVKEMETHIAAQRDSSSTISEPYQIALHAFCERYYKFQSRQDALFIQSIDWDMIQRGMDVFITYSPSVAMVLYYFSLVPGFSIPLINKVLQATQYLAPPSPLNKVMNRLMDTGAFLAILMVRDEKEGDEHDQRLHTPTIPASTLRPGGKGWKMALRVRCLHAKVRRSLLLASSQKWDQENYGIPINQEDMVATLLAFSFNVLYGIEFMAGITLSNQEKVDYMALWRFVGWLLGVDTSILDPCRTNHPRMDSITTKNTFYSCDNNEEKVFRSTTDPLIFQRILMESILCHLMNPDDSSVSMAYHLLQVTTRGDLKANDSNSIRYPRFSFMYRSYLCRRFIGQKLANQLCLPDPMNDPTFLGILAYFLSMTVLIIVRLYLRIIILFPQVRRRAYKSHYRGLDNFLFRWEHGKVRNLKATDASKSCPYYYT